MTTSMSGPRALVLTRLIPLLALTALAVLALPALIVALAGDSVAPAPLTPAIAVGGACALSAVLLHRLRRRVQGPDFELARQSHLRDTPLPRLWIRHTQAVSTTAAALAAVTVWTVLLARLFT